MYCYWGVTAFLFLVAGFCVLRFIVRLYQFKLVFSEKTGQDIMDTSYAKILVSNACQKLFVKKFKDDTGMTSRYEKMISSYEECGKLFSAIMILIVVFMFIGFLHEKMGQSVMP